MLVAESKSASAEKNIFLTCSLIAEPEYWIGVVLLQVHVRKNVKEYNSLPIKLFP